ncbi:ABC transporter permease [Cytobacillus praedii]|uniref:ABC transporter permease n=1 Tax=Cytobacillus praedii TaxID=1742358 RepID=UPI002E1E621B|nr:ABC transporter permease subunit [Cytobacillus praedii]MED3549640.1 ABC transporter permease subunit [Cytobacillus praedii]
MQASITKNKKRIIRILVILLLLCIWQICSYFLPSILLPSPIETYDEFVKLIINGELISQLAQSGFRMLIGLAFGIIIAISSGLIAGKFEVVYEIFRPIYSMIMGLPPIIVVVLAMVWFGTSSAVPIFVVSVLVFPVIYLNTADGWRNIDKQLLEMGAIYKTSHLQNLKHIILPGLAVPIISALSLAAGSAVRITIMAELLGSNSGIGYSLALARVNINTAKVFAWTIICILIILILDHFVLNPVKNYVLRWNKQGT